jgi:hypothetical protein
MADYFADGTTGEADAPMNGTAQAGGDAGMTDEIMVSI